MHVGAAEHTPPLQLSPLQHGDEVEQLCPLERHVGAAAQKPPLHCSPLQHGDDVEQLCPLERHTGAEPHRPVSGLWVKPAQQPFGIWATTPLPAHALLQRSVVELVEPMQLGVVKQHESVAHRAPD